MAVNAQPVELVAIQLSSVPDLATNQRAVVSELDRWHASRAAADALSADSVNHQTLPPALVVLPECFGYFGGSDRDQVALSHSGDIDAFQSWCMALARTYRVWLVTGSIPTPVLASEAASHSTHPPGKPVENSQKIRATSWLINPDGDICATYHKTHLFDVQVADTTRNYRESATTEAGTAPVSYDTPFGNVGMSICYDLRFSQLFHALSAEKPLDVIVLPAAFTYTTGKAHWHTLLAARAIEFQCYVVAANQCGTHPNGRITYGHTAIYSPWGECLTSLPDGQGWISTLTDPAQHATIRHNIPMAQHRKTF